MVPPHLVAQDGLLHQPRVTVQADSGIAPAPHLRDVPGAVVPHLLRGGGTPGLRSQTGLVPKHSELLTIFVMEPDGRRSGLKK